MEDNIRFGGYTSSKEITHDELKKKFEEVLNAIDKAKVRIENNIKEDEKMIVRNGRLGNETK